MAETANPLAAAEALAGSPLFSGLTSVELARLVPELEELSYASDEVVFRQGDAADGLYLIRAGVARVVGRDGRQQTTLALLGAPEYFGEMALLSDSPRSATVQAVTELTTWRLTTERFRELVRRTPTLPLSMAAALSRRLASADRELSRAQRDLRSLADEALQALDPDRRELLLRLAPLDRVDASLLRVALGDDAVPDQLEQLAAESALLQQVGPGRFQIAEPWLRAFLAERLAEALGPEAYQRWIERLLACLGERREILTAARLAARTELWGAAEQLLTEEGERLRQEDPAALEELIRALPPDRWTGESLTRLLAEACQAQGKLEAAIEVYEAALDRAVSGGRPPAADQERALARLYAESGRAGQALGALRSALTAAAAQGEEAGYLEGSAGTIGVLPRGQSAIERVQRGALALAGARALARAGSTLSGLKRAQWAREGRSVLVMLVLLGSWFLPAPPGLSQQALHALLLLVAALAVSMLGWLPEYVASLLMLSLWVTTGIVPTGVAASGFASPTWFLLFATMAVGVGLARSGLMYRAALELLRRLPPSYPVLATALATLGVLLSPGMPNVSGRVSLAGPIAQDLADTLRFPARSGGSAGLALATYLGFGQMSALFLTASPSALILYGLMPAEARAEVSFATWFVAALPLHLVLFAGYLGFILFRFRPAGSHLSTETLRVQRAVLGRLTGSEQVAMLVLLGLLIGFTTQALHGIDPAWLGLLAVALMVATGLLDADALRRGVNWTFLLYLGVALSLNNVFSTLQVDRWLSQSLLPLILMLADQPGAFILGLGLLALLLALLLRMGVTVLLLALALFPISAELGAHPMVVAITLLVAANQWLYPQQSVVYLTLYYGSDERAFSHEQVRLAAFAFAAMVGLGLLVSVPYWRLLGLLQ